MRVLLSFFSLIVLITSAAIPAQAKDAPLSYSDFANIPVLYDGRVIPMDVFAATTLEALSERSHIGTKEAAHTLADILFNPADGAARKIFAISNDAVRARLNIDAPRGALLSLSDLQDSMQNTRGDVESLLARDPASLNKDERALLALHQKTATYIGLMRSLSLILPLNVDVPPRYGDFSDQENIAYLDLARFDARIMNDLQSIIQRKGERCLGMICNLFARAER